ncbi:hypothetical protein [Lysobacter sp. CA199]|uniref:hypothetical protein n=1 Tax=Lysobacter sp. CA199 TaxID=3455608 RepID=UPI003F8D44FE
MTPKTRNFTRRIAHTRAGDGRHQADKIWRAMRMLRRFTVDELVAVVETSTFRTVGSYASVLARTGFLRVWKGPSTGRRGQPPKHYQMVRDSGPIAPSFVKYGTTLYDHNTDTEYPIDASPRT